MERQFELHLGKLRTRIIKMSSLVEEQLEFAIKAFNEEDLKLAELVTERELKVNKLDRKIEKTCQKIIALSQPVAMDLRLVISALTINTNVERIGDLAEHIARSFINLGKKPYFLAKTKYSEMTDLVKKMIRNAIDSFNNNDAELAKKVIEMDNQLDSLFAENRKLIISIMKENSDNIDEALSILEISRHMERIGDHATNIAEDVYFIVEAQLIKHKYEKYIFSEISDEDEEDE
ncbi:MAG: phosphate signaling complex protein PhoU [Ignavibacteriae bacterium]|nr:phosphate signaling complex protein PhoU [Ignavibacteriota bacterium]MCB9206222.1 phosphate signaling complex protein PhoU [Ignavibacteriales bacterium]MCB9217929.1 phosphate signaling complex protein PhoU [Ignavibacteriales bacterium]MCB9260318.1 phosphate signaling complex protein PhoU [Ignavibacteriales bacterium]